MSRFLACRRHPIKWITIYTFALSYLGYSYWNYQDALRKRSVYDICPYQLFMFRSIPLGLSTNLAGWFAKQSIPRPLRHAIYGSFASIYNCNLDECAPLIEYPTFGSFFTRALLPDLRPIDPLASIVSPVDGSLFATGTIESTDFPSSIKGLQYPLNHLYGIHQSSEQRPSIPKASAGNKLYYCSVYLSPGAYHRFHAATNNWSLQSIYRIPGECLPVAPWIMRRIPPIAAINERAVIRGQWSHGHFDMIPVGATNVRSIKLNADSTKEGNVLRAGEEVGFFEMGSLVVLIFEAPSSFQFLQTPGAQLQLGQALGQI